MRIEFLIENIAELDSIALQYFRLNNFETQNKRADGFDPVTQADKEIELALRSLIETNFPQDAIVGEEFQSVAGESGFNWTIDPIDGTRAFVIGAPSFAILCAINNESGFEGAVISQPFTQERFMAIHGEAFYSRGGDEKVAMHTSQTKDLSQAKLASTFPEIGTKAERASFEKVSEQVLLTRYGMDAYAYGLLALGQIDLVIEAGLKPYDYRAPWAVVEAAGGVVMNWEGEPPNGVERIIAAATPELAQAALEHLRASLV